MYTFSIERALGLILLVGYVLKNKKYKRVCQYNDNQLSVDESRTALGTLLVFRYSSRYGTLCIWIVSHFHIG
jgi:hypothetical protein